jgi:hypothetical protein
MIIIFALCDLRVRFELCVEFLFCSCAGNIKVDIAFMNSNDYIMPREPIKEE